jgi:HD superfamily phosphohydrolase
MEDILEVRSSRDDEQMKDWPSQYEPPNAGFTKQVSINDIVYGHISLPQYCWMFIDSPAMQRLKYLHQLGPNYYVFPGATHNRFEHSVGTAYLCSKMMHNLLKQHQPVSKLS